MIKDVPTPDDFHDAGVNLLHLAWTITMDAQQALQVGIGAGGDAEAADEYWQSVQPALANAYSLIQQGMELGLKGRIARVSPYLLLGDPGEWAPKGAKGSASFGELPSLEASKLVAVHNSVVAPALEPAFNSFWTAVRKDRNQIMHSAPSVTFTAGKVIRTILLAANALFAEKSWVDRLYAVEGASKFAIFGLDDHVYSAVVGQVACAIGFLSPAEAIALFGYDPRQRAYLCPACFEATPPDYAINLPKLAQFRRKEPGETELHCVVCATTTTVDRSDCVYPECVGNVIAAGRCLTCDDKQDEHLAINGPVNDGQGDAVYGYDFIFSRPSGRSRPEFLMHHQREDDDDHAIAFGERAITAAHLISWTSVSIFEQTSGTFPFGDGGRQRPLGHWLRHDGTVSWHQDMTIYDPARDGPV
ncbi:hypothetical protein [Sphingomonas sp. Sph1(2015)]|uniref:hypothetical protein n=1 Tax=Sphingomonas sp. Sph1(2015) TaxID=1628084 RepID=UPI0011157743|nr:hypothetical protein [Sphingomonas sp. Sph1(2015)]